MRLILAILDHASAALVVLVIAAMRGLIIGILFGILWPPAGVITGILAFLTGIKPLREWEKHHHG